jgi:ATP-binding cassette subfamily B (MDR/TAP) protein 1
LFVRLLLTFNQRYSTIVGDSGIKLSGGQRQRIAIARSLVKRPKILILDEATSSIDVRGEQVVQAALDKVSKNRTTIVIAHRLATVKKADNIVVLRKGKVVQQGTHEDLMAQEGGAYWALATAQQLVQTSVDDDCETVHSADAEVAEKKSMATIGTDTTLTENTTAVHHGDEEKKTFRRTFLILLYEQNRRWKWYLLLMISALCGGGREPPKSLLTQVPS